MGPGNRDIDTAEGDEFPRIGADPLRVRARVLAALGASLISLALVACGGGGNDESEETPVASGPTEAALEAEEAGPLADLEAELDAAGFTVRSEDALDARAALSADGVDVTFYENPKEARAATDELTDFLRDLPGRGLIEESGNLVIFIGRERMLSEAEKARFREVVAIARKQ